MEIGESLNPLMYHSPKGKTATAKNRGGFFVRGLTKPLRQGIIKWHKEK